MRFLFFHKMNSQQATLIRQKLKAIGEEINGLYIARIWDKNLKERIRAISRLLKETREALNDASR